MKLNLGCGFNKAPDYVNVDKSPLCRPDQLVDLEKFPWPWPDSSIEEIRAWHSLEHLGETTEVWLGIMRELWRVSRPGAAVYIAVPHPRHENFLHDCTHVRAITPMGLAMFDQKRNMKDLELNGMETKLGLYNGVDFELKKIHYNLCEPWGSRMRDGLIKETEMDRILLEQNNVCDEIHIHLQVHKPARFEKWLENQLAGNLNSPDTGAMHSKT